MPKVAQKKNLSSIQVLKTLQVLLSGDYSMQELLDILNENETKKDSSIIFNNSVVSKYINTCRYCDIEIYKIHNKYYVASLPFGIDMSTEEIDLMNLLQVIIKSDMSQKLCKIFDTFIEKLNRFSNRRIARVEKSEFIMSIELFERAVTQRRKVKLLFKNRNELICTPLMVVKSKGKIFFKVNKNRDRFIDITRLSGVETLNDRFVPGSPFEQTVVFTLKGDLAKRYSPRENETILSKDNDGKITISNRGENKELLFSRLLRYDDKCEIQNPKSYREEMKQILDEALKNYGVI